MAKKMQYFIREYYDRPVSKKEFVRWQAQEIEKGYVTQKHLVINKILSLGAIRGYQKQGLLTSMRYKMRTYFKRDEVLVVLKIF